MKNNINDITFKETFNLISPKSKKTNYITVNINDVYTTEVFYDYTYNAHIEFKLYRWFAKKIKYVIIRKQE